MKTLTKYCEAENKSQTALGCENNAEVTTSRSNTRACRPLDRRFVEKASGQILPMQRGDIHFGLNSSVQIKVQITRKTHSKGSAWMRNSKLGSVIWHKRLLKSKISKNYQQHFQNTLRDTEQENQNKAFLKKPDGEQPTAARVASVQKQRCRGSAPRRRLSLDDTV